MKEDIEPEAFAGLFGGAFNSVLFVVLVEDLIIETSLVVSTVVMFLVALFGYSLQMEIEDN